MLTRPSEEPKVEYGKSFVSHLTQIYDNRITHKYEDLLLYSDDVSGAFRWPKLNPYIASSMAYVLLDALCIPLEQVFGNNTSAQNFEQIALARQMLVEKLFGDKSLIEKHNNILKNVKFYDEAPQNTIFI